MPLSIQIDDAKATLAAAAPTIRSAAQAHYASELVTDDRERHVAGSNSVAALNALLAPHRAMLLRLLVGEQLSQEEAKGLMGWAVEDAIAKGTASATTDRRALLKGLAEAQLEAMARAEERDHGKVSPPQPSRAILCDDDDQEATSSQRADPKRSRHRLPRQRPRALNHPAPFFAVAEHSLVRPTRLLRIGPVASSIILGGGRLAHARGAPRRATTGGD